ncbi:MAG: N-acetylmuramoyl-L-alanine amidase [Thermoleophilia bacterium]|nr:N-acetylmuramoyl-L-alanine amidase [Thermoleophilia bacterium]
MSKVYLSPSLQEHNIGLGKYGTEMDRMRQVANAARARLEAAGVIVKVPPRSWAFLDPNVSLAKVVADSNAFGPALHICIHSNAGPKGADGTLTFYMPGSVKGKKIATLIQNRVAPVSPGSDPGLATSPVFYETRAANAPVAYLELAFHTDYKDAESVISHHGAYGRAIANACLEYLGIPQPAPTQQPLPPAPTPLELLKTRVAKLEARVTALEAKNPPA